MVDITDMLGKARGGDRAATDALFATLYRELHRLAAGQLRGDAAHATSLVHEAWEKFAKHGELAVVDREHFFAVAARAMRQIVVDHARRRLADKRGAAVQPVTLDEQIGADALEPVQLVHLDDALGRLQQLEPRLAELVEMRFFAGLSVEQVAELRDVAPRTVIRDWRRARAYLFDSVSSTET